MWPLTTAGTAQHTIVECLSSNGQNPPEGGVQEEEVKADEGRHEWSWPRLEEDMDEDKKN